MEFSFQNSVVKIILSLLAFIKISIAFAGGMDHGGQNLDERFPEGELYIYEGSAYDVEFTRIGKSIYQEIINAEFQFSALEYDPKKLLAAIQTYTPKAVDEDFGKKHDGRQALCNSKEKVIRFRNEHWKDLSKYQKKLLVLHEYLNCEVVPGQDNNYYYTDKTFDLLAKTNVEYRQAPAPSKGNIKLVVNYVKKDKRQILNGEDYILKFANKPWIGKLLSADSNCHYYSGKSEVVLVITKENGNQFTASARLRDRYQCVNFHNYILTADINNPITLTFDRIKGLHIED